MKEVLLLLLVVVVVEKSPNNGSVTLLKNLYIVCKERFTDLGKTNFLMMFQV